MSPVTVGIIGLVVMVILLFSRIPIAFMMTLVGFFGFTYLVSFDGGLNILAKDFFATFNSYSYSVIPLFTFMGMVVFYSGVSSRIFDVAYKWLGHMPGGLAVATVGACAGFGALSGSTVATVATMSVVVLPEMKKYNYESSFACGSIACGSTVDMLIPPSIALVVYGILTQNSIGKLFLGSILTGLLLGALFVITIYILCKRNPSLGPPGPRVKFKDKVASIILLWEVIILFGLVMGGLFMGWFTPTEAAGVGAGGALVLALIKGDLTWKKFLDAGIGTVDATVMAIMLLAGTMVFSRFLAVTRIPFELSSWVGTLPLPPVFVLIAILLIYGIAGCIIESFPFFILTIPIFYPIVMRLGYDPIWYGVLITLVAIMGMITPPAGICCYIVAGIAKDVPLKAVFKGSIPFIPAFVVCAALLIAFPKIVTIIHILLP